MDPKARRFLWNSIMNILRDGRSVVLTSHRSVTWCSPHTGQSRAAHLTQVSHVVLTSHMYWYILVCTYKLKFLILIARSNVLYGGKTLAKPVTLLLQHGRV